MARITSVSHNSRQYLAFPILLGVTDTTQAQVEISIQAVNRFGVAPDPVFAPAEWGEDSASVQVLIGPSTSFPLSHGLYKVIWRITSGSESTIVAGERYLEIH